MLWDIIRDWFVEYIFGGMDSNGSFFQGGFIGYITDSTSDGHSLEPAFNHQVLVNCGFLDDFNYGIGTSQGSVVYTTFADYLSTLATIITLSVFVFILFSILWRLFKEIRNTLSFR